MSAYVLAWADSPADQVPQTEQEKLQTLKQNLFKNNKVTKFEDPFSEEVWSTTYKDHNDQTINDTIFRVAAAAASVEKTDDLRLEWTEKFYDLLTNFKATAGGRIWANAGTEWNGTTLMNCYVGPRVKYDPDSLDSILTHLRAQAHTLKSEGGWGENFSYIRPRGAFIHGIGVETPGAVKYMELFDKSSEIITSGSGKKSTNKKAKGKIRKGAMMGVLDVWHPDIIEFITAKQQPGRLTKFNVSVNCTDDFMEKVIAVLKRKAILDDAIPGTDIYTQKAHDANLAELEELDKWDLIFPDTTFEKYKAEWDGNIKAWIAKGYPVNVYNTVSAIGLWNLIMESTYNRAEPGVLFLDRANYFLPLNYAETVFATNPCFTGDTLIATKQGLKTIEDIVIEQSLSIPILSSLEPVGRHGIEYRQASQAIMTGIKPIVRVELSNGMSIRCTPEHRFWTVDQEYIEAISLVGKQLQLVNFSTLTKTAAPYVAVSKEQTRWVGMGWSEDFAFVLGWATGDGWLSGDKLGLIFGKDDTDALTRVRSIYEKWGFNPSPVIDKNGSTTLYVCSKEFANTLRAYGFIQCRAGTKRVPKAVFVAPDTFVAEFLNGLFSSDGSVVSSVNSNYWISLCSKSKALLNDVQMLLLSFGITHHSTYDINKTSVFEYVTKEGVQKTYIGGEYCDLRIFGKGIQTFYNRVSLTIQRKQQALEQLQTKKFKDKPPVVEVTNVVSDGEEAVYDLTIPETHNFVANGLIVHNCGEQTLAPGGVCNLASLNLTQFINEDRSGFDLDRIEQYTRYLVRFLDNINDLTNAPLSEYEWSIRNKRRIGVGILGWGSALYMLKVRFASKDADILRNIVMETIAKTAYMASIDLAEEKGMFSVCEPKWHKEGPFIKSLGLPKEYMEKLEKTGIRNSSLLSIQPTGNTSILANVVSGGLEPVFLHDYVRTVIVGVVPDEIASVTPKWYEGEWKETEMFKLTKEGDEEILRGVAPDGTTYKIDKNRGLTKEVLCEDYGVRYMRNINEWDANAPWAATRMSMTVQDHVSDLKGFARWVDSAMSKTVNVPNEYPFEDFKNIYLDSYKSGYVKGVTTYRAGTMTTVLAAKDENTPGVEEEIVLEDVKLPDSAPATMKTLKAEGRKWYLTVLWWDDNKTRPFGFFVHTNNHEKTIVASDAVEKLTELARSKGIPERHIEKVLEKISADNNTTKVARMISLNLRHGVLIRNIVAVLDTIEDAYVGSFAFAIKKYLSSFIKDGEKVEGKQCENCGSHNIVYSEGCFKCNDCGSSKCG